MPEQYSLKLLKSSKTKASLRNWNSQEDPKKTWWWNAMWYPAWDLERNKQKRVLGTN